GLRAAAEAVDLARRVVCGAPGSEERAGELPQLVGDRKSGQALPEDRDQQVARRVGRIHSVEALERPAERLEESEVVRPHEAFGREALELGEDPLPGRLADLPGRVAHEPGGFLVELE